MECPACGVALVAVEREGIEIDWCPDCRGLWFDAGEIELLAERSGRRADPARDRAPAGTGGARRCPRCRRRLTAAALGAEEAVELDRCERHGLWFDPGELGRVMRRLSRGAAPAEGPILEFLGEILGGAPAAPPGEGQP